MVHDASAMKNMIMTHRASITKEGFFFTSILVYQRVLTESLCAVIQEDSATNCSRFENRRACSVFVTCRPSEQQGRVPLLTPCGSE